MPETCENWIGIVISCVCFARQTRDPGNALLDLKAPGKPWNPLSETVLSECSFIFNTVHVNIWNDHKAQK